MVELNNELLKTLFANIDLFKQFSQTLALIITKELKINLLDDDESTDDEIQIFEEFTVRRILEGYDDIVLLLNTSIFGKSARLLINLNDLLYQKLTAHDLHRFDFKIVAEDHDEIADYKYIISMKLKPDNEIFMNEL